MMQTSMFFASSFSSFFQKTTASSWHVICTCQTRLSSVRCKDAVGSSLFSTNSFDFKNRKNFLKRTKMEGLTLRDVYVGGALNVFNRHLNIVDYADIHTKNKVSPKAERTLAMLKPDAISNIGSIVKMIVDDGFQIAKLKMVKMEAVHAMQFYEEHKDKPFIGNLVEYITGGPVLGMELVKEAAVRSWRSLIGPTDPVKAREENPNSVRALYGTDKTFNACHGSDSVASAERELAFFFPSTTDDKYHDAPKPTATFKNCTCCIIKPHIIKEGKFGDILIDIQKNKFQISSIQMFYMEHANAEEFYEVYKGVVAEYSSMVGQLISGPCVAMEILSPQGEKTPTAFRDFVGPADPEVARRLRPHTLRAKYGKTKVLNAIHCTDLPEDGLLEVEYFFKILQ